MGNLPKTITFNNLAVPVATGTNTLSNSVGPTIRVENVAGKLATSNYTFNFNGLSIGGEAVTSYMADVDTDEAFTKDTEVVSDGYFHESEFRSAPYFDAQIDGITLLNTNFG